MNAGGGGLTLHVVNMAVSGVFCPRLKSLIFLMFRLQFTL